MDIKNCWKKRISRMLNIIAGGVGPGTGEGCRATTEVDADGGTDTDT